MSRAKITNKEVGEILKIDHTTVSRYRSGDRVPSLGIMLDIATEFNWDLTLQAISKKADAWHDGFEAALSTMYGEATDDAATQATSD